MGSDNAQVLFGETDSADAGRFSSAGIPSPTVEQQAIIEGAVTGKDIKVQAFAGTGKTTTIKQLARVINKPSLYIAFNKDIVSEVGNELPGHVRGKTAHGLAFNSIVVGNPRMEYAEKLVKRLHVRLASEDFRESYLAKQVDLSKKYIVHFSSPELIKGLEFDTVIMAGFENSVWTQADELNKIYVCISRPRKQLAVLADFRKIPEQFKALFS
jgi:superfamily I DNA/RNA helicase